MLEERTRGGEPIHIRRLDDGIAIAAGDGALVIGDEQQNIAKLPLSSGASLRSGRGGRGGENELAAVYG
jgi:hypothetical protein